MTLQLRSTSDDMLEVCLEEDGFRACCFVSSTHLAYEKEKQLRDNIRKQATDAYFNRLGISKLEAAAMEVPMPYDDPLS